MTGSELAILGLVAEAPKYGYQIEQDIESRGMRDWTEVGFSSIYYILNKLEKEQFLESRKISTGDRPARKVYQLTQAGWDAYRGAVSALLSNPRPRTGDFDLGLANLPALSLSEAIEALVSYRDRLAERLNHVMAKKQSDGPDLPFHVDALFNHNIVTLEAELTWVDGLIKKSVEMELLETTKKDFENE